MKKFQRSTVWVLLAVFLLVMTAGCGTASEEGKKEQTATTAGNTVAGETEKEQLPPVTLTIWGRQLGWNIPSGVQADPVAKEIEKKLGITIDLETSVSDEKFAAILASGDLPDICAVQGKYFKQMIEGNAVKELDALVEARGKDILKNIPTAIAYSKEYYSNGSNKLYFIPQNVTPKTNRPYPSYGGMWLRWDYYKELGAPEIKSYDDFINTVEQMIAKHPANEEGKKFTGFSPWFDQGAIFAITVFTQYMEGALVYDNVLQIGLDVPVIKDLYRDDASVFWHGAQFWNKVYRKGLLDPDTFVQKYQTAIQKGSTNQVLASVFNWQLKPSNEYLDKAGLKGKGYVEIPMIGSKNIFYNPSPFGYREGWSLSISDNCKNPDRAMDLINYLYSLDGAMTVLNGIEGTDWVMENGKAKFTDTHIENRKDPEYYQKFGFEKYSSLLGFNPDFLNPETNQAVAIQHSREELLRNKDKMIDLEKDYTGFYNVELAEDVPLKFVTPYTNATAELVMSGYLPLETPDEIKLIGERVNNYINQAAPKLVMAKTDEAFNAEKSKIIEELEGMGLDKAFQFYKARYDDIIQKSK